MSTTIKTFRTATRFHAPFLTTVLYKRVPKFRGYWQLLEKLARVLPRSQTVFWANVTIENRVYRIPVDVRDPYQIAVFAENKEELCVPATMALLLKRDDFYLDVGANAGWYCRFMSQQVGETGLVVALEPNNRAFRYLRKLALPNFLPLPYAATTRNGEQLRDTSSALQQAASAKFKLAGETQDYGVGETFAMGRSLDSLLSEFRRQPAVIKIDVEGAELHVLKGATQTLQHVKGVMIEVNENSTCAEYGYDFTQIYDLMRDAGFVHTYEARNRDNTLNRLGNDERFPSDIFFTRQELQS